jgi:hypothetical protein
MVGHLYFSNGRMLHFAKKIKSASFLVLKVAKDYNVSYETVRHVVRAACKMQAGGGVANRNVVES